MLWLSFPCSNSGKNGNSWVPIPVTDSETGTSTATKMTVPSTTEEKTSRFGGNEATKKTQKALLKQQLAILGVVTSLEDLNVKFLRSLPFEWDTHVVKVKKSASASNDDKNLAFLTTSGASSTNNINTVNPEVSTATKKVNTASTKISTASFSDATVYAFLSTQPQGSQLVHEDLEQLHDDDLEEMDLKWNMALLSMRARKFYQRTGRKIIIDGSNTAGYDKSKVECFNCHKMGHFARECRAPRSKDNRNWNQGSSSKAVKIEDASEKAMCAIDGAGFDWSDMAKEEIQANMAHMAFSDSEVTNDKSCYKSCLKNYEALKKQYDDLLVKLDDTGFKAATYKRGLATLEGQIIKYREHEVLFSKEIALLKRSVGHKEYQMGLLRSKLEKVKQEKEGFEFKITKFDKSTKDLSEMLESQITDKSKKGVGYHAVPSPHPLILNRPTPLDLSYSGLEEFKEPEVNEYGPRDSSLKPTTGCDKESDNSKENTDVSLKQQQMTDSKTSSVKSPLKVDKDWKEKFFYPANHVREVEPKKVRENNDAPIIEDWVSDDEDDDEPNPKVEKKTVIPTATKKEFVKPEKPVRRSVRYAEMYRSQRPRGNQRNWNGQKSNQLGCNFVFNNKACFICGSFDHIQYSCPNQQRKRIVSGNNYNKKDNDYYSKTSHSSAHKHMAPRAVLMKTGLKSVNTARPVNTVRSVNTGRPFSTARSFNTVRPSYTAHPKSTIHCARPRTYFQNQAQSTVHRPFYKRTTLTKRCFNQRFNTGRPFRSTVNTVRARGFNAVKPSACWVWRPIKPNGASLSNSQLNDKGFVDSGCSRHMTGNIAHLSDFKDFDGGYVTFGGGAYGGRITGKVNTARPEVNTGSREVSTAVPEVNTATPEDLVGPSPTSEDLVGPSPTSEDSHSSVQTRRMKTSYSEKGFLIAIYEGKTHQDLHTCLFVCFLYQEEPKRVSQALRDPAWVIEQLVQSGYTETRKMKKGMSTETKQDLMLKGHTQEEGIYYDEFEKRYEGISFKKSSIMGNHLLLGYSVQLNKNGNFISQDKYVHESRERSMIGSLMYLTSSRPDIMFVVCACARFQDSSLDSVSIYTDRETNAGATQDRKSTTGLLTEAEIVAAGKLLWKCSLDTKPTARFMGTNFHVDTVIYMTILVQSAGSAGFHQVIDFLNRSHICYALRKKPAVSVSFIKQFWRSAEAQQMIDRRIKINATIDGHSMSITEGSLKRHLKLADQDGITSIPNSDIFEQLALMGYHIDSDKFGVLEDDLKKTKKTYSSAYTKLILRVKTLESQIKTGKARRKARVVLSDDEVIEDDSSKQGRKLSDAEVQEKAILDEQKKGTATEEVPIVSTAEVNLSTARGTVTYTRRSAEKRSRQDKGKAIMIEFEPKKKSKKELEHERLVLQKAIRLEEKMNEDQRAQIDFNQHIEPMEHGTEKMKSPEKSPEKMKSPEKIVEEDVDTQEDVKEPGAKRKESIPRKSNKG
ncbi:ribonuclease H-like domain-containing protein [Tanacetum coccineum]